MRRVMGGRCAGVAQISQEGTRLVLLRPQIYGLDPLMQVRLPSSLCNHADNILLGKFSIRPNSEVSSMPWFDQCQIPHSNTHLFPMQK